MLVRGFHRQQGHCRKSVGISSNADIKSHENFTGMLHGKTGDNICNSLEQLVTIELFGQSHTFGAETEISKAKEVADLLVKEVARVEGQLSAKSSMIPRQTILILAALNIAGENYELKKKYSERLKTVSERSANLIQALDMCLQS